MFQSSLHLFFAARTKESNTCASFCARQPTAILRVFARSKVNAWICAPRSTDRDLQSRRKFCADAWTLARETTDHDLESVNDMRNGECLDNCTAETDRDLARVILDKTWKICYFRNFMRT